ncbi:MAG: Anti-sigma H sporulation factor, LonB [Clostridia bacterium 41_269]|nr:MAG: Anti-sigma H sporulation factor, LonB [Clostridia bacterium 41_269]
MSELTIGISGLLNFIQIFFAVVIGLYFWNLLRSQQNNKAVIERESKKEMEKLQKMRNIRLTEPLSERTRPTTFKEIVGQEEGLKALRAALCSSNPQHVIIYGPPGVGKTAAARLVLEEAKANPKSPFNKNSKFVEVDGTTARFDERGIADPLIGSVHDPIYQGAGAMGIVGIPQPKPGAVTKAHGGILFIDEIGELHMTQINKLLKVLEDRKVMLESAYYSSEDTNIPSYIHDIFQKGLPADFRLVAATTRMPHEIPEAVRSRCVEIFFRELTPDEIGIIASNAAEKINFELSGEALETIKKFAKNGREAVNIVQIAASLADIELRKNIEASDVEWIINHGQYSPRIITKVPKRPQIGYANGLAMYGPSMGVLLEVEVSAVSAFYKKGIINITGIVEEEEMGLEGKKIRRKSMVKSSLENVLTALRINFNIEPRDYNLHVNFPGDIPIDGPSAGAAVAAAVYSAVKGIPVDNTVAMTGEVSIKGSILPVGGIAAKINAARNAGAKKVLIPRDNWQHLFQKFKDIDIVPIDNVKNLIKEALIFPADASLSAFGFGEKAGL